MSHATSSSSSSGPLGRRSVRRGRRGPDATIVLALVLPVVTVAAALLVHPDLPTTPDRPPPAETVLTSTSVICPSGEPRAFVATTGDASGEVPVRFGGAERTADVEPGRVVQVRANGAPAVVEAEGALAPGLVVGRFESPLAAAECREPVPDQWFTGVGAGARHRSVLELVNPDAGPAVVDVAIYGRSGLVEAPGVRGVAVPAGGVVRIDLAETVPRRDELSLRLTTSRGRVHASIRDRFDNLGPGRPSSDWLPAQAEPVTSNLMLGIERGPGQRTLVLANAGEDQTRASIKIVTGDSVFAPRGVDEVTVPPRSVARVTLSEVLSGEAAEGAVGLLVESRAPLTAGLRSITGGDLSHAVASTPITSATAVIVPRGRKQVQLAGAAVAGSVLVTARDTEGEVVGERTVEVVPGRGYSVQVPRQAVLVEVTPTGTEILASVLVSGSGTTVVRLRDLRRTSLVGDVRPALP
ncbi:MAG: DUF5719 family protein [Nocardioides sp.]